MRRAAEFGLYLLWALLLVGIYVQAQAGWDLLLRYVSDPTI